MKVLILISVCVSPYFTSSGDHESCPTGADFNMAGKCLWFIDNRENFSSAQQECALSGGVLVDVQDQETNEAVKSIINEKRFTHGAWIGVHDMTGQSRYTNMFNQTIQFANWNFAEPDEKDKQCTKVECVKMDTVGEWMDVCCSNSIPAICSKQLLQFNTSDVINTSGQTLASQLTQWTEQQTTSQSTQWETTSQSTQWETTDQYSTKSTEQQTTLSLAPSNLTVQISTSSADRSSTIEGVILSSESQISLVTDITDAMLQSSGTVESASVPTGPTSQPPSSPQLTTTAEPYPTAIHQELIPTSQSTTSSDKQSKTSELSTESQTKPSNTATRDCFCPCERTKNLLIIENEAQLKAKIDMMRKDLAVNKQLLSSSIRRKISVSDSRPSAVVIGSTLGVSLITLVMVLILVSDFHHLITDIRHGLQNIRRAFFFLKRHKLKNRSIFASQGFSGPSHSPKNVCGE